MAKDVHAFQRIQKDIEKALPSVVLLYGKEGFLVHWAKELILDRCLGAAERSLNLTEIHGMEWEAADVIEACETLPFLAERKVVLLDDPPELWKDGGERGRLLEEYLEDLPSTTLLLITGRRGLERNEKPKALFSAIEKAGRVYDFRPLDRTDLRKFVEKRLRSAEKQADYEVIKAIVEGSDYLVPDGDYDLYRLENDLQKIVFHARGERLRNEDVTSCLSDSMEQSIFKLTDAIGENRKGDALRLLRDQLRNGAAPMVLLGALSAHIERMLMVKEMAMDGLGLEEMARTLKVHTFPVEKAMKAARRYELPALRHMLYRAFSLEGEIKKGSLPDEQCLELFIAEI